MYHVTTTSIIAVVQNNQTWNMAKRIVKNLGPVGIKSKVSLPLVCSFAWQQCVSFGPPGWKAGFFLGSCSNPGTPDPNMTSSVIADHAQTLPFACSSSNILAKHSTCILEILDGEFGAPNDQIVDYRAGHFANMTSSVTADRVQTLLSLVGAQKYWQNTVPAAPKFLMTSLELPMNK